MKEFWVYTLLRIVLFAGSLALVGGIWLAIAGSAPWVWVVLISFLVSGLGSLVLLNPQRTAFAARVETRAARMTQAFDERRAREDAD